MRRFEVISTTSLFNGFLFMGEYRGAKDIAWDIKSV